MTSYLTSPLLLLPLALAGIAACDFELVEKDPSVQVEFGVDYLRSARLVITIEDRNNNGDTEPYRAILPAPAVFLEIPLPDRQVGLLDDACPRLASDFVVTANGQAPAYVNAAGTTETNTWSTCQRNAHVGFYLTMPANPITIVFAQGGLTATAQLSVERVQPEILSASGSLVAPGSEVVVTTPPHHDEQYAKYRAINARFCSRADLATCGRDGVAVPVTQGSDGVHLIVPGLPKGEWLLFIYCQHAVVLSNARVVACSGLSSCSVSGSAEGYYGPVILQVE